MRWIPGLLVTGLILGVSGTLIVQYIARARVVGEWRPVDSISVVLGIVATYLGVVLGAYHFRGLRALERFGSTTLARMRESFERELAAMHDTFEREQQAMKTQIEALQRMLETSLDRLTAVQQSVSTRYLGQFPTFLDYLIDLLTGAAKTIRIYCDSPAYAFFTAHESAIRYLQVLQSKALQGVRIELTCPDAETRHRFEDEQFNSDLWNRWQQDDEQKERLAKFLAGRVAEPRHVDREGFIRALDEADLTYLREIFRGAIDEVPTDFPVYLWIVDENTPACRAIFAIPCSADKAEWNEPAFITSDQALIKALQDMTVRYQQRVKAAKLTKLQRPKNRINRDSHPLDPPVAV